MKLFKKSKIVEYLLIFTDYKGGVTFNFRKVLLTLEDKNHYRDLHLLYDPIENDFSRDEMRIFMIEFMYYVLRFRDYIIDDYKKEFYRALEYCCMIYGFRDSQFFIERYKDSDEFSHAKSTILSKGSVAFNKVKANN